MSDRRSLSYFIYLRVRTLLSCFRPCPESGHALLLSLLFGDQEITESTSRGDLGALSLSS